MNKDLFENAILPEEIGIYIFADERKKVNNRWDYIGILWIF